MTVRSYPPGCQCLYETLKLNISDEEQLELDPEINTLITVFEARMKADEEGLIDSISGPGTRVWIRGLDQGIIPGKAFIIALLSVWIGESSVNHTFKRGHSGY